ncbi:MAG: hypothetical protein QM496_10705 [Verrucomicrobiota bacterium]
MNVSILKARFLFIVAFGFVFIWSCNLFAGITIKTESGREYKNAEVKKVEAGQVSLGHAGGLARISLADLSRATRQALKLEPTMEMAQWDFDASIKGFRKRIEALDDTYASHLEKLEKSSKIEGVLDHVLEVRKEIESFRSGARLDLKYDKLIKLRAIYDKEKNKRKNSIADDLELVLRQQQKDLRFVQKSLTIAGKVDEAILAKQKEEQVIVLLADRKEALDGLGLFASQEAKEGAAEPDPRATYYGPEGDMSKRKAATMIVLSIGDSPNIPIPSKKQSGKVIDMQGNWESWAALKKDGSLLYSRGDKILQKDDLENVSWLRVGAGVVTVFHLDGAVSVIGETYSPNDSPPEDLKYVKQFGLGRGSGIALLSSGKLSLWGSMYKDPKSREALQEQFEGAKFVAASENIAWVVDQKGNVWCWRAGGEAEMVGQHDDIARFEAGKSDYMVLTGIGILKAGSFMEGRDTTENVPQGQREGRTIRLDYWGYALQSKSGNWRTWGGSPESAPLHGEMGRLGKLLNLKISAKEGQFAIYGLQK